MRLLPIVEQLKACGLVRVQGVLELISLKAPPARLPAYFVVPDAETAGPNSFTGGPIMQRTEARFGVVIMLGVGANQEKTSDELQLEEDRVIDAVLGWIHPDAADGKACEYVGARMLTVVPGVLSWMVSFKTGRTIRKVT